MNLDWKEIYSIANNSTFEEFLKYVKVFDKEKDELIEHYKNVAK